MGKQCPHCGAPLHEDASFCPRCARALNQRKAVHPPRYLPRKVLYGVLFILAAVGLLLLAGQTARGRPQVYDNGGAEMICPTANGSVRLCIASEKAPGLPIPQNDLYLEVDLSYRHPVQLYATDEASGELVTEAFMGEVESITAEVSSSDEYLSITCTDPQEQSEHFPAAAAVIFIDSSILTPGDHTAELVCTVTMRSGDVIRLHQQQRFSSVAACKYTAQDVPMNTIQELQALVDEISTTADQLEQVYLYLPPVVYEGGLTLRDRTVHLYGSVGADGQRTTFTGTIQASCRTGVHSFNNISVLGSGTGTGICVSDLARVHLTNCRIAGWETGYQALESAWINATESVFEDNTVAMHFDSTDGLVSRNFYTGNVFRNNGTAVLLERIASSSPLVFPGTLFTGNGQDIDNRCGQAVDLGEALFE